MNCVGLFGINCIVLVITKLLRFPKSAFISASCTDYALSFVLSTFKLLYITLLPSGDIIVLLVGTSVKVSGLILTILPISAARSSSILESQFFLFAIWSLSEKSCL